MIKLSNLSTKAIYEQIYDEFVKLIVLDVLKEGDKLPSVRELALMIQINPNTIQKAFKQLEANCFIKSIKGKGNFVNDKTDIFSNYKNKLEKDLNVTIKEMIAIGISKECIIDHIANVTEEVINHVEN